MKTDNSPTTIHRSLFTIHRSFRAFTLIELLVVISIIGVLATLIIANVNGVRERARDATRKSDLRNIQTALRSYYNDYSRNPCDNGPNQSSGFRIRGCSVNAVCENVSVCEWGSSFGISATGQVYMATLPNDPQAPGGNACQGERCYRYDLDETSPEDYVLQACLENANDPDCTTTANWCAGCVYQVTP